MYPWLSDRDIFSAYSSNSGDLLGPTTYGHTGYTGTSVVIDPDNKLAVILLTNRAHPNDRGDVIRLRSIVANTVAASIVKLQAEQQGAAIPATPSAITETHYSRRVRQFDQEPQITPNDIVMLGNSITEGGKWNSLLGIENVRNRGISGDIASGVFSRMYQIANGKPQKVFLLIGINDISKNIPNDTILENIQKIVVDIKTKSPATEIYLQSILPFNQSMRGNTRLENKEKTVLEANNKIKALSLKHKIHYIDIYPLFVEKNTDILKKDFTYDGLHLNNEGYKVWAKELKKQL